MTTHFLRAEGVKHAALRDELKRTFGLDDEDQTLADTLEGASDFNDLVAASLREMTVIEAQAEALQKIIKDMQERKARMEHTVERIRSVVATAMQEAGERKITLPDMTLSVRTEKRKVVIPDATAIPDRFQVPVLTLKPNKEVIKAELDAGRTVEGAHLSNGGPSLTIRRK